MVDAAASAARPAPQILLLGLLYSSAPLGVHADHPKGPSTFSPDLPGVEKVIDFRFIQTCVPLSKSPNFPRTQFSHL